MKRINKLKLTKYPDGGVKPAQPPVSDKAAAATETRSFNNITPMVDPTTGAVNWNLWNSALTAFPQGYNTAGDPTKKNPNEVNTVNYYVGNTIVPAIRTRQEVLNAAYAKKYGKTYDPKNPASFQPTEDQYLDPETANKALQEAKLGTYDDYLQYTNAYNSYRSKTQIANTNTQGTQEAPTGPENYGIRHYNLFVPGYTPTQQPTNTNQPAPATLPKKALGGRFGDVMKDIGDMSWQDAGQLANNYGKATADTMLSTIGLSNVVPDDAYKGAGADMFKKTSGAMGKVGQMALPIALQAAGVPMGVTKAAQAGLGMINPQDQQQFGDGGLASQTQVSKFAKKKVNPESYLPRNNKIMLYPNGGTYKGKNGETYTWDPQLKQYIIAPTSMNAGKGAKTAKQIAAEKKKINSNLNNSPVAPVRKPNSTVSKDNTNSNINLKRTTQQESNKQYSSPEQKEEYLKKDAEYKQTQSKVDIPNYKASTDHKNDPRFNNADTLPVKDPYNTNTIYYPGDYNKEKGIPVEYPDGSTDYISSLDYRMSISPFRYVYQNQNENQESSFSNERLERPIDFQTFGKMPGTLQNVGSKFPMGGVSQNPNAELEKEEVFQMPNGQVEQVDGPSHEQGGVPVNIPEGTRIWSDRLKVKGKTFAKLAAKYKTDKEEKIISDVKSSLRSRQSAELNMKTKTKKLDELFMTQEGMKAKKINSYIKRYGGVQQYPEGGQSNDPYAYLRPNGYNSPENMVEFPLEQRMTQFTEPDELNPEAPGEITSNAGNVFGFGNQDNPFSLEPNSPEVNPNNGLSYETPIEPNTYYNSKTGNMETLNMNSQGDTPYSNPEADLTPMDKISDLYKNNKEDINKGLGEAATFGMNNLANLAYLKNEGKRYDKVNYGKINPNLMSDEESIRQIKEGYNTGLYNLKNSGNLSQSGRVAMASERMKQGAAAKERIANTNTGIKNQFEQINKDLEIKGMQDEAANKGQAKTNYYTALGSMGQNAALQTRDYKQRAMDQKKLSLVNSIFPNYKFDPKTFEYMFTLAQKQQGI